jgi:hypothetical protein
LGHTDLLFRLLVAAAAHLLAHILRHISIL